MGPADRREREKEEVRRKILDAARSLLIEIGYEAVSMRKIAEKIEYSPTAIYLHFKDKESLVQELCANDFLAFSKHFASVLTIADPVERLLGASHAYVDFALAHPEQYRRMFMTPHPTPPSAEARERRGNPQEDAYAFVRQLVQVAIEEGRVRDDVGDVSLVAQTVWAAIHGVISLEIAMKKNMDEWIDWAPLEKRVKLMVDTIVRGLTR